MEKREKGGKQGKVKIRLEGDDVKAMVTNIKKGGGKRKICRGLRDTKLREKKTTKERYDRGGGGKRITNRRDGGGYGSGMDGGGSTSISRRISKARVTGEVGRAAKKLMERGANGDETTVKNLGIRALWEEGLAGNRATWEHALL